MFPVTMEDNTKRFIAVDAVIFSVIDSKLCVFLKKREKEPYLGLLELLGGFVLSNETAQETLRRKLKEISDETVEFTQFDVFSDPKRDPRNKVVSIGYTALVNEEKAKRIGNFYELDKVSKLSFDHCEILAKARDYIKYNIKTILKRQSLPLHFTLNYLQLIYEIIEGIKYDNRNFRKKMINDSIVKKTESIERDVAHRPGILYKLAIN